MRAISYILLPIITFLFSAYGSATGNHTIQSAYQGKVSNVQIESAGIVVKVLPDDNKGSRHQKFILKLAAGGTILVAHNIDLAPRIRSLKAGDSVQFYGEYEWTSKGGVIHWTHHDPSAKHEGGWLRHNGKLYE